MVDKIFKNELFLRFEICLTYESVSETIRQSTYYVPMTATDDF